MKFTLLVQSIIFITLAPLYGQVKGGVYDTETKEGISFTNVWVSLKNSGTVADGNGKFELTGAVPGDTLIFSAVGYEVKKWALTGSADSIFLKPQPILLQEVTINKRRINSMHIGTLKGKERMLADFTRHTNSKGSFVVAKYFPPDDIYSNLLYLKKITVKTRAGTNDKFITIAVRSVNEDGEPGDFLHDKNIICHLKKGERKLRVDLSDYGIQLPREGFFITFEKFLQEQPEEESYGPQIIMYKREGRIDTVCWSFESGQWRWHLIKSHSIAMEIEVGN